DVDGGDSPVRSASLCKTSPSELTDPRLRDLAIAMNVARSERRKPLSLEVGVVDVDRVALQPSCDRAHAVTHVGGKAFVVRGRAVGGDIEPSVRDLEGEVGFRPALRYQPPREDRTHQ